MEKVVIRYKPNDYKDNLVQVGGVDISKITSAVTVAIKAHKPSEIGITIEAMTCDITTEGEVKFNLQPVPEWIARDTYEKLKAHFDPASTKRDKGLKKIKMETAGRCLIWHRWQLIKDTGITQYHECKDCPSRIAQQPKGSEYEPINHSWVLGKSNDV